MAKFNPKRSKYQKKQQIEEEINSLTTRAKLNSKRGKEQKKKQIEDEINSLTKRVTEEAPARGYAPPLQQRVAFRALPLSEATLRGLEEAKPSPFTTMTAIQNACIPHALAGRDILGAARTGSGKTLAFLIPILEVLYRHQFVPADGPGAAVLSPTRELAVQIFQVLKVVGKYHSFSVGLLIGGRKDFLQEQQRVGSTNIIIATPGRLLQHCSETPSPYFDLSSLKILVLDEADRILDMGFRDQLVHILEYIPKPDEGRQTLLFSATQTKDVSSLATLSLHKPEYLGVHDKEKTSTPESLKQSYVVVPLEHKLNAVYSFIKSHLKCKTILFLASCAQVRYAWELFCSLRPGVPVMALHGKLVQSKRTQIYFNFLQRPHAVLFATDIAARGLDFPNVDWVVQVDAPEDRDMYIHRAGRTARYRAGGKSLLLLTPSEERKGFIEMLQGGGGKNNNHAKLFLKKLNINPTKTFLVTQRAASMVASNVDLNRLAKKACQSYVRSIYLMPHKEIFDVSDLPLEEFSKSLGLASTPNLRFLQKLSSDRSEVRRKKNVNHKLHRLKEQIKAEKLAKRLKKLGKTEAEIETAMSKKQEKERDESGDESDDTDDEDTVLVSKSDQSWKDNNNNDNAEDGPLPDAGLNEVSKSRHPKKIRIHGSNASNKRIVFNDEGEEEDADGLLMKPAAVEEKLKKNKKDLKQATDEYVQRIRQRLESNYEKDVLEEKERVREKRKKRRLAEKGEQEENTLEEDDAGEAIVTLGTPVELEGDDHQSTSDDASLRNSSSSEDSSTSFSSSSSSSASSVDESDLKAQEEMALSLIRGNS